ncbi:MAG: aminotransferase class III-fold pyridoxal phosphate-dependent enzyme [Acidimicrobiia bacterium]|nr:MAG: aminotransferase class III-fold pyridoxal phosphate-dependent enzyme [Acidimicrobiia bacterium]
MTDLATRLHSTIAPVITFDHEIEVVDGQGTWITDIDGKRYLDFACGIAVNNLGHRPPTVEAAAKRQLGKLWHAGGAFLYDSLVTAGENIIEVAPDGIEKVLFMNSGAEAVEAAVKLAKKTSGRQGVIVFRGGFHGRTMGAVSYTTSRVKYRQGYHPVVPSVFVTPFPHPFRWGMSQEQANAYALNELRLTFKHVISPEEVAAFLIEPIQGEGGYYPASRQFLSAIREIADEHGILLIVDEVQTGFGRTGDWFTSQIYDIRPDVLVMGKAIANGLPLSAVGASQALLAQWEPGSHGTTFGGNPISCAASAATVDALKDVIPGVAERSDHAFTRLGDLQERHRTVGDVRGMGLMIGVELVGADRIPDTEAFPAIASYAVEHGLVILSCGPDGNVIRFVPPLNVSIDDLDAGINILDDALGAYEAS